MKRMDSWLAGKRIVLTGISRGIGRAAADAVKRLLDTLSLDWAVTGKFVKGTDVLPW